MLLDLNTKQVSCHVYYLSIKSDSDSKIDIIVPDSGRVCHTINGWFLFIFLFFETSLCHLCLSELEHNNLTEINKGWLYGLRMLRILRVNQNAVGIIRPDAWEFCQKLEEL